MPLDRKLLAETTGFHHNCGLNSLVHVLIKHIRRGDIPRPAIAAFCEAFNQYYGSRVPVERFTKIILDINNPVDREVILSPVLRSMYSLPEMRDDIRPDRIAEVIKPYEFLEDNEVLVMANFFGIRVESYSSLRSQALEILPADPKPREEAINAKIEELRGNPRDLEGEDRLDPYAEVQNRRMIALKMGGDIPVLKLWNKSAGHFEYEEDSEASKNEHNNYYREFHAQFPHGFPEPAALKAKISAALNGPVAALNLPAVMAAHKKACSERPHAPRGAGRASGAGAGGLFKGFSDLFGGAGISDFGSKIAGTLLSAFKGVGDPFSKAVSSKSPGNDDKTGISSMPWMQILEGIVSIMMHLANGLSGTMSMIPAIKGEMNPSLDLNTSDFDKHPDAQLFSEYAGKLPENARKALNIKWRGCVKNNQDTRPIMDALIKALRDARQYDDASELAFNYKLDKITDSDRQQHLSEQWARINQAFSGDQRSKAQKRIHLELDELIPPVVFARKPVVAHRPGAPRADAAGARAARPGRVI